MCKNSPSELASSLQPLNQGVGGGEDWNFEGIIQIPLSHLRSFFLGCTISSASKFQNCKSFILAKRHNCKPLEVCLMQIKETVSAILLVCELISFDDIKRFFLADLIFYLILCIYMSIYLCICVCSQAQLQTYYYSF